MVTVPRQPQNRPVAFAPGRAPVPVRSQTPTVTAASAGSAASAEATPGAGPPARRIARLPVAAAVATLLAVLTSAAPVAALAIVGAWGWASPYDAMQAAAATWLLAHGVPVGAPDDPITLAPLAVSALAFWRVGRAGVHTSRAIGGNLSPSRWRIAAATLAVAATYAGFGYAAAVLAGSRSGLAPLPAAGRLGAFAAIAAGLWALRHSRAGRQLVARLPAVLRDAARTGAAAAALLGAAGAAAAGIALAVHSGGAANMLGAYEVGVAGQIGITVACLAYLPNLAIWGAAYLLGPGFSMGAGTVVSPTEVVSGPIPGLPVLAALPSGSLTGAGLALLGIPVLAGVVAGALVARLRQRPWLARLGAAVLSGPVAGMVLHLASRVSAGGLGSGRLATLGPSGGWAVGVLAALVIAVGALLGALTAPAVRRPARRTG